MVDTFIKQLDGCSYYTGGANCTCASGAMLIYRSTGGRVKLSACDVRRETGDRSGGTHLGQIQAVAINHGVTKGVVYRPISSTLLTQLAATGKYGFILQISYSVIAGTAYDCFSRKFKGNHAVYVSGKGTKTGTWRVADPGADGRRSGIPTGYQDIPISLMLKGAALLDIGGRRLGTGKAYVYMSPPDASTVPMPHRGAVTTRGTALWNDASKRWVYNGANNVPAGTKLEIRGVQFPKGGQACYPVTEGSYASNYPGYYVPVKNVRIVV